MGEEKLAAAVEERITVLERRLEDRIAEDHHCAQTFEARLRCLESAPLWRRLVAGRGDPKPAMRVGAAEGRPWTRPSAVGSESRASTAASLSDLIGGRVLAWVGGAAVLLGLILFLSLAIAHGWIGTEARVVLSAVASLVLMGAGIWLHDHRGRAEAALAMVGTATAGLFATLIVASEVYGLIPSAVAVAGSLLTGSVATILAIRWAARAIGALGLLGALVSPVLVGAGVSTATIVVLAVAMACAMAVVVWQHWTWLAVAAVLTAAPQWGSWAFENRSAATIALGLATFTALGLIGVIGAQMRAAEQRVAPSVAWLTALSALLAGTIGHLALHNAAGAAVSELWLAGLAATHLGLGILRHRRVHLPAQLRHLLVALGVILADVAFGLSADGIVLALGWSATAIAFTALVRRTDSPGPERSLLGVGLGAHLALVLLRTVIEAPPSQLGAGDAQLVPLISVSLLAATSFACSRLGESGRREWGIALDGLAMLAIAYLSAGALDGSALVAAWAFEGLALARLSQRTSDQTAHYGSLGFLALAVAHTLVWEAPPWALLTGVPDLAAATLALVALMITTGLAGRTQREQSRWRSGLTAAGAAAALYLLSVTCITVFQPAAGTVFDTVLDLSVRQQGQVLLSVLWSATGLAGLIFGLKSSNGPIRSAALALLLVAVGKVFLYDLATLTSIYRVTSFIVLGLLLLTSAFAYQRLRPPPQPDLRSLHPSQR